MGKLRVLVTNSEVPQEAMELLKERYVYALVSHTFQHLHSEKVIRQK
jgi:hypothetical protein